MLIYREFHALLSTDIGHQVVSLLGRHKRDSVLGHKLVNSITVFAVDTRKVVRYPPPEGDAPGLVKWPVIIWEIVDFDEDRVKAAREREAEYMERKSLSHSTRHQLAKDFVSEKPRVVLPDDAIKASAQTPGNRVLK